MTSITSYLQNVSSDNLRSDFLYFETFILNNYQNSVYNSMRPPPENTNLCILIGFFNISFAREIIRDIELRKVQQPRFEG